MMICPQVFYENNLKGKNADEIMTVIRSLKQEIGRLKNIMESPHYEPQFCPKESVRIACSREYLQRAKEALVEAGGQYTPSAAERRIAEFDARIPHIRRIEFCIGGYFSGYETKTYTLEGERVNLSVEHTFKPNGIETDDYDGWNREELLEQIGDLHLGEWRRHYNLKRFGCVVMDGTQWHLIIEYTDGKNFEVSGDNAYPYNFDGLLEIFDIDSEE